MKKFIYLIGFVCSSLLFSSCGEESNKEFEPIQEKQIEPGEHILSPMMKINA